MRQVSHQNKHAICLLHPLSNQAIIEENVLAMPTSGKDASVIVDLASKLL